MLTLNGNVSLPPANLFKVFFNDGHKSCHNDKTINYTLELEVQSTIQYVLAWSHDEGCLIAIVHYYIRLPLNSDFLHSLRTMLSRSEWWHSGSGTSYT